MVFNEITNDDFIFTYQELSASHRNSGVAWVSAALSTPEVRLQELQMKEGDVSWLLKIYGIIKHSQTVKGLLFIGVMSVVCLVVVTFLIITLPISSAFFTYAYMNLVCFVKFSFPLAFNLR